MISGIQIKEWKEQGYSHEIVKPKNVSSGKGTYNMYPTWNVLSTGAQTNMHVSAIIVLLTLVILRLGDVVHTSSRSSEKGSYSSSQAEANLLTKNTFSCEKYQVGVGGSRWERVAGSEASNGLMCQHPEGGIDRMIVDDLS